MNKHQLEVCVDKVMTKMFEIIRKKNSDYATTSDAFSNFSLVEKMGIVSTEKGILVRMSDKMARLGNLMGNNSPKNESIEDTILDIGNYAILLLCYLSKKRGG